MRISALSVQTGIPVATIKFYLRERLLPPGTATGRNQAEYGEQHARRLWLIRMLTTIGQMELSAVREVLEALEDQTLPLAALYAIVHRAAARDVPDSMVDRLEDVCAEVDDLLDRLGWHIAPDAPARTQLYLITTALRRLGCVDHIDFFLPYALAASQLAGHELDVNAREGQPVDRAAAVARAILFDSAVTALRHMAREHHAAVRFKTRDAQFHGIRGNQP